MQDLRMTEQRRLIGDDYSIKIMKRRGASPELIKSIKVVDSFFEPKDKDMIKICRLLADTNCKTFLDVGCGKGKFLRSLAIALHDVSFLGIDTRFWDEPLPHNSLPNLTYQYNGVEAMAGAMGKPKEKTYDAVMCVWMPYGSDWREYLCGLSNKLVILILDKDFVVLC